MDLNDLPKARTLLDFLRSEIRVRTYHLPLATHPAASQAAARLLVQKKMREAGTVLLVALNTLVVIDQVSAIPLLAKEAINEAQTQALRDREAARNLLEIANHEPERGMELGYTPDDSDYKALRDEIKNLRKQLKGNEDTASVFARLKEELASLARRQAEKQTRSDVQKPAAQKQPQKAA